jgi:hypothetical protein
MSHDFLLESLVDSLSHIEVAEASLMDGSRQFSVEKIQASILSKFLEFISSNAENLPPKEVVLDLLSKAIDLAFTALNRPIIAGLLKPIVKAQILTIAGNFYDSLFTPSIQV